MKVRGIAIGASVAFAALVFGATSAAGQPVAESVLDHYLCYKLKDLKNPAFVKLEGIPIDDQATRFLGTVDTKKIWVLCMPSSKYGADPNALLNPAALLCGYKVKSNPRKFADPRPVIDVTSQFQAHSVELKKPFLLMAPCDLLTLSLP